MVAGYSLFRSFFPLRAMLIIDRINFPDNRTKRAGTPRSKKQMIIQMQAA